MHLRSLQKQQSYSGLALHCELISMCMRVCVCMPGVPHFNHFKMLLQRGLHAPHADPAFPGSSSSNGEATSPSDSSTAAAPAFSGVAQLVLFLSGPPDTAYGKTVAATAAGNRPPGAGAADATISPGSGDLTRQVREQGRRCWQQSVDLHKHLILSGARHSGF